jgi:uncharacterized protein (TIGR02145 family)
MTNFIWSQNKKDIILEKQRVFDSLQIESIKLANSNKSKSDSLNALVVEKKSLLEEETKRNTLLSIKVNSYNDSIAAVQKDNQKLMDLLDSLRQEITLLDERLALNPELTLIKNQIWMTENLKRNKFNNGDLIFLADSNTEWINCGDKKIPAYYVVLDNDGDSLFLYNWYAINDKRGLLPAGFKIPSNEELMELENSLGSLVAPMLKKVNVWSNSTATDDFGFGASPGFLRDEKGNLYENVFGIWSATEVTMDSAIGFTLDDIVDYPHRDTFNKNEGFLIRGIKK